MPPDLSEPLSDTPDGTTDHAHVANTCLPAGERPKRMPIFIAGVSDTRSFGALLRASCPKGLMAQLKSENLMVVPTTADCFRSAVSVLWSLDGKETEFSHLHSPRGLLSATAGEETG